MARKKDMVRRNHKPIEAILVNLYCRSESVKVTYL